MSNDSLMSACKELARQVLWNNGDSSSDVVETLADRYFRIAQDYQNFVRQQREDDVVIEAAVRYLAHVHAIPPHGTDTTWFLQSMNVLIELAVPNIGLTPDAGRLLPHLQQGISESSSDLPTSRAAERIDEDDAKYVKFLQDAGREYGAVSDLLDTVEKVYYRDPLTKDDRTILKIAALSAPLTRHARKEQSDT